LWCNEPCGHIGQMQTGRLAGRLQPCPVFSLLNACWEKHLSPKVAVHPQNKPRCSLINEAADRAFNT